MLSILLAAAVASASPSPSPTPVPTAKPVYQGMQWREIGPALPGGRTANVAGSTKDPNLYYVASAGGGVWKTTDGGETWTAVFDKESVASTSDVVIDPTDDNTVWVATGEGNPRNDVIPGAGVYKSTDGGKSFKKVGLEKTRTITRILIDSSDHNHVLVGALGDIYQPNEDRGVYATQDGGKTWTKTLYASDKTGVSDMAMDPKHPNVVYAGMWHFKRTPWTTESGSEDGGLFKSTDGGKNWKKLAGGGLPDGITGRIGLAIAPSDGNRVYALIESSQGILWRSDDGGNKWEMVSKDTLADQRPFYFSHVYVDPSDKDHLIALSAALATSHDGGKTWKAMQNPHSDLHGMWIAPNDPKRMMIAEDGGVIRTLDGGGTWFFGRNLPVGEVYHVGVGLVGNPYWLCGGWQDNNAWCGPAFSTDPSGILNKNWINVNGGDGEWAVPDPLDKNWMWADAQGAFVQVYNRATRDGIPALPYFALAGANFDLRQAKYRFNWDSPIAFAPWDGHVAWVGGNVLFQTTDRGRSFTPISPDLTLNEKDHQAPPGGPITHDVSSAENYNTILDIEGSTLHKGEIWVGTDDGQVQYTVDGGKQWHNVTPPGVPDHGSVETVAPSTTRDGTVFVSIDRHLMGDYKPYVFVSNNFGKTWSDIGKNLPEGTWYARSVRQDLHNGNIVYAGTETGMYVSCNGGTSWADFKNDQLPTVAVRDIRFQPQWDDMIIATHGRALYVMDDLRPIQQYACSRPDQAFVIGPRVSYNYNLHGDDEGIYTDYAGNNPNFGATFWYYQPKPGAEAPKLEIMTTSGKVIHTFVGNKPENPFGPPPDPKASPKPVIANGAGLQQFTWDYAVDGPVKWNGAARIFKGPNEGPQVVPGTYRYRMTVDGKVFTGSFVVKPDPDSIFKQADYQTAFDYNMWFNDKLSQLDIGLNSLDDLKDSLEKARAAAQAKNDTASVASIDAALKSRQGLLDSLTADYQNFEDFILRPGKLREDLQNGTGLVTPALTDLKNRVNAEFNQEKTLYDAYIASLPSVNDTLTKAGYASLKMPKPL